MDQFAPLTLHAPMPKPSSTPDILAPAPHHLPSSSDAHLTQAQAASMRRKKNADAQAAFRARRANYIASLEETVTSLEAVVLSLQDTCREARSDAEDLRHQNARLVSAMESMKQATRDREKQWREFWQAKQQALGLDESHMNDFPPRLSGTPPTAELHPSISSRQYVDEALRFQTSNTPSGEGYPLSPSKDADQRYPAPLQPFTANPEGNWIPGPFSNTRTPCVGDPHPSQSSEASDSPPSISPGVQYPPRFPINSEDNRMSLVNLSMSSSSYESGSLGVPDYGYHHRHGLSDSERYAGRQRRAYSGPNPRGGDLYATDVSIQRATSPLQMTHAESEGLNGDLHAGDGSHLRPRRHTSASLMHGPSAGLPPSHSPSSSPPPRDRERDREPPMSNTLAVIKAQAFGSLRRTRTRTKKPSDTGSKVAIDILEARGIGMGVQPASAHTASSGSGPRGHSKRKGDLDDVEMNS
ncbi:hypothetical protein K439DRAFT_1626350 [Ramaria rubella]|nr:hypothetical protein K439DRAFT_1626350 [Ramaria rubella]